MIGDMPHAYQWVTLHVENPRIPNRTEEAISFQSYADRDGVFAKSPTHTSPGGHVHSYDQHTGAVDWEIWVGVLPRYKGDLTQTAAAINRYFAQKSCFSSETAPDCKRVHQQLGWVGGQFRRILRA